ncbi:Sin3 associated polypeptide p18 [Colletotrichum higginsianum IMI 349063]|uniref:Sin3 associated polypeptide p18 n=2 Tax=Colletotrichum higginsianum TaxID=80884 RepID=A0A1B7YQD2_COLHI|nr:Sin3 associated polypeptide p18 [Colletotrichum higginsianum IMI 349063]OBR14256.1 Sin3 associated polypeptide p18 [Colletotrichum higginsianum IMI 349063]TID01985.1 Histone deacetylase complex subunit SAP18 [Colletotrichum higginsianum]
MASVKRDETTPFLLQVFYKTGSFHRTDEFASRSLPPALSLYTWSDCTLTELAGQIVANDPSLLPSPSVGSRLAFRLIYPDTRHTAAPSSTHHTQIPAPRFMVKDLGSVVLGEGAAGAILAAAAAAGEEGPGDIRMADGTATVGDDTAKDKTLGDAKFVVGDYISCAILPPLPDGSVAPALTARNDRTAVPFSARGGLGGLAPQGPRRDAAFGGRQARDRDRRRPGFGDDAFPEGEWRRGERLPEDPPDRSWGRGRRQDRW